MRKLRHNNSTTALRSQFTMPAATQGTVDRIIAMTGAFRTFRT